MKVLVFGAGGQLGTALGQTASDGAIELVAAPRAVDVASAPEVASFIAEIAPDWIVNAAAMTDVDGAHVDPERAMAVNGLGPGNLALAAAHLGARLIHISTEAVFDGESSTAYAESDMCCPVSVYGASKLAGEHLARIYAPDSYVLRTSWLYSGSEGMNFPTRLLAQLADPAKAISVVTDIVGNPTPTTVLVDAILAVMSAPPAPGLYHACCTGAASKFDWAVAIAESAGFDPARITPVTSDAYPTVALRPKHVDLDCSKFLATGLVVLPTWREAWQRVASGDC